MGAIVIVSGLPGVGKTTVVDLAIDMLRNEGIKVGLVNYGTVMLEAAKEMGLVSHRDEMRKLKVSQQLELQRLAAKKISNLSLNYDVLLVDTHLFISTPRGKWPGLSINNLQFLDIAQIIVVEASPNEILKRRMSDKTRYRDVVDEESLRQDIEYNRVLAATLSIHTSCPVAYIPNHEGEAEAAAKMLYEILSRVVSDIGHP